MSHMSSIGCVILSPFLVFFVRTAPFQGAPSLGSKLPNPAGGRLPGHRGRSCSALCRLEGDACPLTCLLGSCGCLKWCGRCSSVIGLVDIVMPRVRGFDWYSSRNVLRWIRAANCCPLTCRPACVSLALLHPHASSASRLPATVLHKTSAVHCFHTPGLRADVFQKSLAPYLSTRH